MQGEAGRMDAMTEAAERSHTEALLEVEGLTTFFYTRQGMVKAVDGVSFTLRPS